MIPTPPSLYLHLKNYLHGNAFIAYFIGSIVKRDRGGKNLSNHVESRLCYVDLGKQGFI